MRTLYVHVIVFMGIACALASPAAAELADRPLPPMALVAEQASEGVRLSWEPPLVTVNPLTAYRVYRINETARQFLGEVDANVTTYFDATTDDRAVTYYVTAVANGGESPPSNVAFADYPRCLELLILEPPFLQTRCVWPLPPGVGAQIVSDEANETLEIFDL
jgi:hypothetical protein